jgi:adenylate cyclase
VPEERTPLARRSPEEVWRGILTGQIASYRRYRRLLGLIPAGRRCKICHAPFDGPVGLLMRLLAHGPYNKNPRFCNW